jgi:hypothetical protein
MRIARSRLASRPQISRSNL